MQPGYDTMLKQIRDFSSDDDDDDDDGSSDSEIDDLPIVDFTVQEDIKRVHLHQCSVVYWLPLFSKSVFYYLFSAVHDIRPNTVIWAKYRQFPFWPVLVSACGMCMCMELWESMFTGSER